MQMGMTSTKKQYLTPASHSPLTHPVPVLLELKTNPDEWLDVTACANNLIRRMRGKGGTEGLRTALYTQS